MPVPYPRAGDGQINLNIFKEARAEKVASVKLSLVSLSCFADFRILYFINEGKVGMEQTMCLIEK